MGLYSDLNLDNGVYIPQYAGAPLAEIKDTADTLSTRHYENLARANQLGILQHQLRANLLPGARDYADQHIKAVDSALQDMAKNGGENSTARINALVGQFSGDEKLIRAQEIAKARARDTEAGNEIRQKTGKAALFKPEYEKYLNANINDPLYENPYVPSAAIELNPVDDMQQVLKEMHPDSFQSADLTPVQQTKLSDLVTQMKSGKLDVPAFFRQYGEMGISPKKIEALKEQITNSYKLTPSYKQQQDYKGRSNEELQQQIMDYAQIKTFKQQENKIIVDPFARQGSGGKETSYALPTFAPGQNIKTIIPYNDEGRSPSINGPTSTDVLMTDEERSAILNPNKDQALHPQAVKDLATAKEVLGEQATWNNGVETPKADKAYLQEYTKLIKDRVEHAATMPFTKQQLEEVNSDLRSRAFLREYMDEKTGEVVSPYNEKRFKEVTGGDPSKWLAESVYDPKNHFTTGPASNEKFAMPIAVTYVDDDKVAHRFLASQLPGPYYNPSIATKTNQIYTTVNTRPGQDFEIGGGVTAKEIYGKQKETLSDAQKAYSYPIAASIPGYLGGQTHIYDGPEHLAATIAGLSSKGNQ